MQPVNVINFIQPPSIWHCYFQIILTKIANLKKICSQYGEKERMVILLLLSIVVVDYELKVMIMIQY